jgi:hypothetical protein
MVSVFGSDFKTESCYFKKQLLYGFRELDGLIQTLGNVARVKKSAQNHCSVSRAFLNSRNIPTCLDQAIQTRKP